MIAEDFVEVLAIIFERYFDIVCYVRNNDIPDAFGGYVGIFVLMM
jgi:hypothetical protein